MDYGKVGDHIVIESQHVGDVRRTGVIVEVLGGGDDTHYVVRWEDGHRSTFYPSAGSAHVIHEPAERSRRK